MCTSARTRSSRSTRSAASSARRPSTATTAGHRPGAAVGPRAVRGRAGVGDRGLPASVGSAGTRPAAAGQQVVRVPPKLMAQARASARTRGKSDPIDALAVARAFLREPDLPVASHDEVSRELKLLVDRREVLVGQRTRRSTGCCGGFMSSIPSTPPKPRRWIWPSTATCGPGCEPARLVAELARDELADSITAHRTHQCSWPNASVNACAGRPDPAGDAWLRRVDRGQTRRRSRRGHPLQKRSRIRPPRRRRADPGVVGQHRRPGPDDPLRQPSTQRRPAPHRGHPDPPRRPRPAYYRKRLAAGDSTTEALRCLKRRLARVVFHHLHTDHKTAPAMPTGSGLT